MTCDECGRTRQHGDDAWWVDHDTRHILCPRCANTEERMQTLPGKNIYTGTPGDGWGGVSS